MLRKEVSKKKMWLDVMSGEEEEEEGDVLLGVG